MTVTFDDIYTKFISITQIEPQFYPSTDDAKIDLITTGISEITSRISNPIVVDTVGETVEFTENKIEQLIVFHMKYIIMSRVLSYKNSMFTTYSKEIGLRNANMQLNSIHNELSLLDSKIERLYLWLNDTLDL